MKDDDYLGLYVELDNGASVCLWFPDEDSRRGAYRMLTSYIEHDYVIPLNKTWGYNGEMLINPRHIVYVRMVDEE